MKNFKFLFLMLIVLLLTVALASCDGLGVGTGTGEGSGEGEGEACEHIWATEATTDKAATCTEAGQKSIKCTVCQATKEGSAEVIPATGHTAATDAAKAPTCDTTGLTEGSHCSVCSTVLVAQDEVAALGHSYGEPVVVNATCTVAGTSTKTCATCGDADVTAISATGHIWSPTATTDKAATCTEYGIETIKCFVCGEKKADSATAIPATGHNYKSQTIAPTCTDVGTYTKTCTTCGYVNTTTTPATGHIWAATATTDKAATCTEEGSASNKCIVCGEKKADSVTAIPATGHIWATTATTDKYASCTENGQMSKKCTTCQTPDPNSVIVLPASHVWGAATVDTAATCTTAGQKSVKCITCQGVKEGSVEVLPAKHEWAMEATIDKAPTETEAGQKSVKCLNCNQPNPDTIVILPALNDTYSYPVDTIEPSEGEIYAFVKDSKYYGSKFAETPGKYYTLIDLSTLEAAYNYVTFTKAAEAAGIYYTFLTEEPVANGYPYYATGYFGLTERRNSKDGVISVHIPEDAAYIYIACSNGEESYLPESIVFSYADFVDPNEAITDGTADFYEYPMDAIVMGEGSIYNTDGVYKSKDTANGYFRVAFIDLTDCAFNTIRMGTSFTSKNVLYTFLTEMPQLGDTISYATGYSGPWMSYPFKDDFVATNYEFTVTIPADAKVLAIYYTDYWYFNGFDDYWGPSYIVLENGEGGESGGNTDPTP